MNADGATVGTRVRSLRDFNGVDAGTEGVIDEEYGTGVMVAWDLDDRPLPDGYPESADDPQTRGKVLTTGPRGFEIPILRDGFSKSFEEPFFDEVLERVVESELDWLEVVAP